MSYYCTASFKKINSLKEFEDFLSLLKKEACDKEIVKKIIERNIFYCPLSKPHLSCYYKKITKEEAYRCDELEYWLTRIFTFKFTFIETLNDEPFNYLCMLGIPDELQHLFDGSICFQNSCDQNYDKSAYCDIPEFNKIYDYWTIKARDEKVFSYLRRAEDDSEEYKDALIYFLNTKNHDYERKCAAYKMIAEPVEGLLYDDKTTTYIQLFRYFDNTLELGKYKDACLSMFKFDNNFKLNNE